MTGPRPVQTAWGACRGADGQATFRIWAPACASLQVQTEAGLTAMQAAGEGWFEAEVAGLQTDSAYCFVLEDGGVVPDPAARAQVADVHGPSRLDDSGSYQWLTPDWRGRPWHEAIVYELHIGTFTQEGTFEAAIGKLDHLAKLGVTAVEIMPVAQFSGDRGWGYDGVLLYAPHRAYGGPDGLKMFVDAAHARGLMVLLDVVYNHFGPDGNYLHSYASAFFDTGRSTPWGAGIDYRQRPVRQFFTDNAVYWLSEYFIDGLRLDAVDQIADPSEPELLEEIARTVRATFPDREIHLTTEDNRNITRLHARDSDNRVHFYTAEWNDDFHNVAHVIATGEGEGYYRDFVEQPVARLARSLTEGYVYQGEVSGNSGRPRGEPSTTLPPVAFIDFLQNHDQIGNRAHGERLARLARADLLPVLTAITLLSPSIPLLFMGEEWGETQPFLFFTDFHGDLAAAVRDGRRREFGDWPAFRDEAARARIPDPNARSTFEASKLSWERAGEAAGRDQLAFYHELLSIRTRAIVPLLPKTRGGRAAVRQATDDVIAVTWQLDGALLHLDANLGNDPRTGPEVPAGDVLYRWPDGAIDSPLPGPSVIVRLSADADA